MRKLVLPLMAAAMAAAPAQAAEVIEYDGQRAVARDDPSVPAWDPTDGAAGCGTQAADRGPQALAAKGPSVRKAVRDAYLAGAITEEQHDRWRAGYLAARSARKRLRGPRRAELHSVIATLERIAARRSLTASRMPALFLQLERNTEWWSGRASAGIARAAQVPNGAPCPGAGGGGGGSSRVTFKGSELVFQHYAGKGLQIQPLANFGKANALYNNCVAEYADPTQPCRREALQQLLDELLAVRARRGDFATWEYYFDFGGGRPPWTSGLSQGTAIQAYARASALLARPDYLQAAKDALGAFRTAPPVGVRVAAGGGSHYLLYSFNPRLRVLNGFIQALNGLHDYAQISADLEAAQLFEEGNRAALAELPSYDTGAWSLYNQGGRESTLSYHRLVRDFLRGLCTRTSAPPYCETADRFTRYLSERTAVELLGPARTRQGRATSIRFRISKASCVWLIVKRRGKVAHARRLLLGYGTRTLSWTPARPGTYEIRLEAIDFRNHHTVMRSEIEVLRRKRKR